MRFCAPSSICRKDTGIVPGAEAAPTWTSTAASGTRTPGELAGIATSHCDPVAATSTTSE